ncbi:MAG: glutathione S-transferase family protein [Rhodospirillaceae bacterium]|nr:glutathione S-transferase family protein [Rhodospirillaceae bacterium]
MSDIELFSFEACPFAQRTRMMMIEKGIECNLTEVDLYNKPDWWKELSPHGKVPLIKHNGEIVYESRIINEYLEDVFPHPPLLPRDPLRKANARIWIDYCDTYFLPALHKLIEDRHDEDKQRENRAAVADKFLFIENEGLKNLGSAPFFMGKEITLVDLQFMPFIERFPCYAELWGATIPKECTRLGEWIKSMEQRESHKKTVNTLEFHMQRYQKYNKVT